MTFHFPDQVDTNKLTIDATDPEVGHGGVQGGGDQRREARVRRRSKTRRRGREPARPRQSVADGHPPRPGAEPTAAERAALDGVLGPPGSSWEGGARLAGPAGNTAQGGHEARDRRHLLLPALWALQERIGWISPGGLNEICRRLTIPPADAYGVASFYALLALEPRPARVVHVCDDLACRCHGCARADRAARGAVRRRGRALRRRLGHVVSQPLPRPVRPRAGGAAERGGRAAARARRRAGDGRRTCSPCSPAASRAPTRSRCPPGRRRGCGCSAASATSTRSASTRTGRAAATRRSGGRSSSGRRGRP